MKWKLKSDKDVLAVLRPQLVHTISNCPGDTKYSIICNVEELYEPDNITTFADLGLTQSAASREVGVSRQLFIYWITGQSRIPEHQVRKLCELLGCNAEDILTPAALRFMRMQDKKNKEAGVQ